jgi:hypothetical protein
MQIVCQPVGTRSVSMARGDFVRAGLRYRKTVSAAPHVRPSRIEGGSGAANSQKRLGIGAVEWTRTTDLLITNQLLFADRQTESPRRGQASLRRAVVEYMEHYGAERNHQGLQNRLIHARTAVPANDGAILCHARLGGMLNFYYRKAARSYLSRFWTTRPPSGPCGTRTMAGTRPWSCRMSSCCLDGEPRRCACPLDGPYTGP